MIWFMVGFRDGNNGDLLTYIRNTPPCILKPSRPSDESAIILSEQTLEAKGVVGGGKTASCLVWAALVASCFSFVKFMVLFSNYCVALLVCYHRLHYVFTWSIIAP